MDYSTPWDTELLRPWAEDDITPSDVLDLSDWKITLPIDGDDSNSSPDEIKENELSNNYESDFLYVGEDGGVVFNVLPTNEDTATTTNSSNPRTELREMLRSGDTSIPTNPDDDNPSNENNWVFGSATPNEEHLPGGINGELTATLAINRVAEFSEAEDNEARVAIGQIHAGVVNESGGEVPLLLFYRKLPDEEKGTIYLQAEDANNEDFEEYDFFLDSGNSSDGIALGEQFSYSIKAEGNEVTVTLSRDGEPDLTHTVDYSGKGYDDPDQFLYFKAGAYVQDSSTTEGDYTQVTFYQLDNTHDAVELDAANSPEENSPEILPEVLYSQETFRETLPGTLGTPTIYDFDDVLNSTEGGEQDVIRNFETELDIIDLSDLGFIGLDTDGGSTELGEIRLAYSSASDRTYLRSDQSEFEAFIEGGDYTSLSGQNFAFAANTNNII